MTIMNNKTLIIAEAGVNYNGSLDMAYRMVDAAKEAGADYVKFQTAKPEKVISIYAEKADYQKSTTGCHENQLEMVKKLLLKYEDFILLKKYCIAKKIGFLSTPFDIESIDFLDKLGCDYWKIPSGEITNYPYLVEIAKKNKPVIMSTGMCEMSEISEAMTLLRKNGCTDISLLHCNTQYPTPYEDVNLNAMVTLKEAFKVRIGYSDHTMGIEIPIAAVAMGASIIEKHFTLDRKMEGPDQGSSLEPDELKKMISSIRNIEKAMGDGKKRVSSSERPNIVAARKSIVAQTRIHKGEVFTYENITTKRPGNGITPMLWPEIIGKIANKDYEEDELITF